MSDNGNRNIPTLAPARTPRNPVIDAVIDRGGTFDTDAFHVMNARDDAMVEQEILNGAGSAKFVYAFEIAGAKVEGISVVGARQLAAIAGQLRHRMVSSVSKTGALLVFTTYPGPDVPMSVSTSLVHSLATEEDYYEIVIEVTDISNGNSIQQRARESKVEYRRDGSSYERPHYDRIADSKAYRNAVLALVRQDIQLRWKQDMLKLGKQDIITDSVLDAKRAGVLRYAARSGIPIERDAVRALTMDQILGMSDAANEGRQPAFVQAATALGLLQPRIESEGTPGQTQAPVQGTQAPRQGNRRGQRSQGATDAPSGPRDDIPPNDGGEGTAGAPADVQPKQNGGGGAAAAPTDGTNQRTRDQLEASNLIGRINGAERPAQIDTMLRDMVTAAFLRRLESDWPDGRTQVMQAASTRKTALEATAGENDP